MPSDFPFPDPARAVHDVLGIGNAIVDVLARAPESFLTERDLDKGAMTLIDVSQATALYDAMGPAREVSGGSAANTIAGVASFGGRGAYVGKVSDDTLGRIFSHDMRAQGVEFVTALSTDSTPTARCFVFVTPDAQRTMCTYLGACLNLKADDVDPAQVADASVTYLEGYLWDPEDAKAAFRKAIDAAHAARRLVAFSLSDSFCVDRHREEFRDLVAGHVDVLFANEAEVKALFRVDTFDAALQALRGKVGIAALTRSEKGSVIVAGEEVHVVDAHPVAKVVDTTGAGDLYAAGFLHGLAQGRDLATCARLGGLAAAEVISHFGARPEVALDTLARDAGLA